MMRKAPSEIRVTISVICERGSDELHKAVTISRGGALSEKNRWRFDSGDKRSTNSCIIAASVGSDGRISALVPSRRMSDPDSARLDRRGGMYRGRKFLIVNVSMASATRVSAPESFRAQPSPDR